MSTQRLSYLVVISLNRDLNQKLDYIKVIERFANMKTKKGRRVKLKKMADCISYLGRKFFYIHTNNGRNHVKSRL